MKGWEIQKILAANIKSARSTLGFTQAELAEKAKISVGHMNDIERSRRWVGADTLAQLSEGLKMDPFQLLLPSSDSPYFDRYHTLTAFSRVVKEGMNHAVDEALESILKPYGPSREGE